MNSLDDLLLAGAADLGMSLCDVHLEKFKAYYEFLREENERVNLTRILTEEEVAVKHFLDSLTFLKLIDKSGTRLIDIGTGAGFPSVPVKIVRDDVRLVLLDAQKKRVLFLEKLVRRLDLVGVEVIHGRAEDLARRVGHRESYDYAVSRAVARMPVLLEYCMPFVKVGGSFVTSKGPNLQEEMAEAEGAVKLLGGRVKKMVPLKLPLTGDRRYLIEIVKLEKTPDKYPRRSGIPEKKPLLF